MKFLIISVKQVIKTNIAAIKKAEELGEWVIEEHPEIVELYQRIRNVPAWSIKSYRRYAERNIWSQGRIAREIFPDAEETSMEVATTAIRYALDRLLTSQDRIELGELHHLAGTYHTLSEYGTPRENLTEEENKEAQRKAIEARARKLGQIFWGDEETRYAVRLSRLPKYRRGEKVRTSRLADTLNEEYHNNRNGRSLSTFFRTSRVKALQQNL